MSLLSHIKKMIDYKVWADHVTYQKLAKVDPAELVKVRQTNFKTILHTLNHLYVVEDIFKAHLTGGTHDYTSRNTDTSPNLPELWQKRQKMNDWYLEFTSNQSDESLEEIINFTFVGGGAGRMSVADILTHIVNHATYHRGFVGDMMYQIPSRPTPTDYPVYIRDAISKD